MVLLLLLLLSPNAPAAWPMMASARIAKIRKDAFFGRARLAAGSDAMPAPVSSARRERERERERTSRSPVHASLATRAPFASPTSLGKTAASLDGTGPSSASR